MGRDAGHAVSLSQGRRWINDLLAVSRGIPIITIERRINVSSLSVLRSMTYPRLAWSLLFTKAYAIVAARRPELRRTYLQWPWPHLYEAQESIASIAVERTIEGESVVLFGRLREPNRQSLSHMMLTLQKWKTQPLERVKEFRRLQRLSRFPLPLRRLIWWYGLNVSGRKRMKHFGTFGVSVTSAEGAVCRNLISPLSTNLNYGVISPDGWVNVQLHFDHRVLDGMPAARALLELEAVLNQEICQELRQPVSPGRLGVAQVDLITSDW